MLLVTLALKTLLSISQNRMDQITLNKQFSNHINKDTIKASRSMFTSFCWPALLAKGLNKDPPVWLG
jgi:hypothetical protein